MTKNRMKYKCKDRSKYKCKGKGKCECKSGRKSKYIALPGGGILGCGGGGGGGPHAPATSWRSHNLLSVATKKAKNIKKAEREECPGRLYLDFVTSQWKVFKSMDQHQS